MENTKIYGVLFRNTTKVYYFKTESLDIKIDDYVIVSTENGEQYGKVVSTVSKAKQDDEYKDIIRVADEKDQSQYFKNLKDEAEALKKVKKVINELHLDMNVINVAYNFDRTQLLINFYADDRVDFRDLAKKLASIYHTRIELRQVGARDKAKQVGGIGICGHELCCTKFLNQIDSISMNRAKNQGLALNPNKINGSCGRLLCCLCYEDDVYTEMKKDLLPVGTEINYEKQKYKIIGIDILKKTYKLQNDDEIISIKADELNDSKK